MEEKELTRLLRSNVDATKRGWRCPDDNQLAAYVNRQVAEPGRQKLEAHFASCKACLETLAFVAQAFDEPSAYSVPAHLLARARSLADNKRPVVWCSEKRGVRFYVARYEMKNRPSFEAYALSEYSAYRIEVFCPDGPHWPLEYNLALIIARTGWTLERTR
ncbi:MAG TPA: hypothetical protein VGJ66_14325 [Pyrinomonadaceae bacterium]|jgi:hypothetical protein